MQINQDIFWKNRDQFRLGELVTETPHPETKDLTDLAINQLPKAFDLFQKIDQHALSVVSKNISLIENLSQLITTTFSNNRKVFLCGCGATGRLSLTIERMYREYCRREGLEEQSERVVSFMAGGDLALVKSIERFEDREDFGARQLRDLGFQEGDICFAITEGGETPFVIGALEESLRLSKNTGVFLYCNPDDVLCRLAARSKRVIENPRVLKGNLTHGPQALSGSTRLQASSVLLTTAALALGGKKSIEAFKKFESDFQKISYQNFSPLTIREQESLKYQEMITYHGPDDLLISLFTDTTERSPTFSLYPFEHSSERRNFRSLSYLTMKAADAKEAWSKILGRPARALDWEGEESEVKDVAGTERLLGHEFQENILIKRAVWFKGHWALTVKRVADGLVFDDERGIQVQFPLKKYESFFDLLSEHLLIKMILNAHSTLLMCRMGRTQSNLMTYVRPSNFKLIDRAGRYAQILLRAEGQEYELDQIIQRCFEIKDQIGVDQPIVLKLLESLKKTPPV